MAEQTQIVREAPEIEALKLGLMESAKKATDTPKTLPAYQIAGLTDLQRKALDNLTSGGLGDFTSLLDEAAGRFRGSTGSFDPSSVTQYMDPYTDSVIDATQRDILEQRQMLDPTLDANAISAGAFGGSRAGVQAGLADKAAMQQIADTSARLRSAGFQNALAQAATDFENQQRRMGESASGIQSLGGLLPQLMQQQLGFQYDVGGLEQAQNQAVLDAERQTKLAQMFEPEQRLGFLSDIYQGAPSSSMTTISGTSPAAPSPFQQLFGYGIAGLSAAAGAKNLGLFG